MQIQIRTSLAEPQTGEEFVPHRPARPEKAEGGRSFQLTSDYEPAGDQPTAIRELVEGIREGQENSQVLLGVTGSGKTYTMAQIIQHTQRPALVLAPNKILAAQLYGEFKSFFPNNAVEYFVSYYDYYQPEAYVPRSDTYIEKESSVNEAIDRMRHSATRSLLERDDVIIVASVSCLYGIGSVETYSAMTFSLKKGESVDQRETIRKLVALQYKRNANNALDMALTGFSLVTTYDFRPDLWNTKPPLVIWLMSGSLSLFGFHEWALRVPSALAALGTLALTLWFTRKVTGSRGLAIGSAILLLLSPGFFGEHGARTGDFDATLLMFVTAGLQLFYLASLQRRPALRLLLAAGGAIGLGALAKSIAAFIPVVGAPLFILCCGRLKQVLALWQRYLLAGLAALGPLLVFYAAREAAAPGYLGAVVFNDLAGRYSQALVPETSPTYYLEHLIKGWFFAGPLLLALPLGLRGLGPRQRVLAVYAGCIVVAALAIYSSAATRAMQYALPLFPWLAILVAIALKRLLRLFFSNQWADGKRLVPVVLMIGFCLLGTQLTARALWWRYEMFPARQSGPQASYGELFASLAARGVSQVTIIDPGFGREDERGYSPLLRWHRVVWATRGLATTHLLAEPVTATTLLASCEPAIYDTWGNAGTERIGLCAIRNPKPR